MNYAEKIGMYYGEPKVDDLLSQLMILDKPKLKRGDDTTYLSNHELGVELTFEDAESLDQPRREYPDGALVLTNIRFYGISVGLFSAFKGTLPHGIEFGTKREELLSNLGEPGWISSSGNKFRWETEEPWLLVSMNDRGEAEILSLQHPM